MSGNANTMLVDGMLMLTSASPQLQQATMEIMLNQNSEMAGFLNTISEDSQSRLINMMIENKAVRDAIVGGPEAAGADAGADSDFNLASIPPGVSNLIILEADNDPAFRENFFANLHNPEALQAVLRTEMREDGNFAMQVAGDDAVRSFIFSDDGTAPDTVAAAAAHPGQGAAAAFPEEGMEAPPMRPPQQVESGNPPAADSDMPALAGITDMLDQGNLMAMLGPLMENLMNSPIGQLLGGVFTFLAESLGNLFGSDELLVAGGGPQHEPGHGPADDLLPAGTTVHRTNDDGPGTDSYRVGQTQDLQQQPQQQEPTPGQATEPEAFRPPQF